MKKINCFAYGEECMILEIMECEGCKFFKTKAKKRQDDINTIKRLKKIGYPEEALKKVQGYKEYKR